MARLSQIQCYKTTILENPARSISWYVIGHCANITFQMKLFLKILIICSLVVLGLKITSKPFANSDSIFGRLSNTLNSNNKVILKTNGIDKSTINLFWEYDIGGKQIIKNGVIKNKIGYEYGPNKFKLNPIGNVEMTFHQMKTNNWHSHTYNFNIEKIEGGLKIEFMAKGPNFIHTVSEFNLEGKLNGKSIEYYSNRKIKNEIEYQSGIRNGSYISYYVNGNTESAIIYIDGIKQENELHFNMDGSIDYSYSIKAL